MRYGMNPHQAARIVSENNPVRPLNGEPSLINYLDALNAWQLVQTAAEATGRPVAASFKHVSPAGVAIAGPLDETMCETWGLDRNVDAVTSAYVRARDGDPKSSFGDVIAVSQTVTPELADFLMHVVSDAIVAPDYAPGVVGQLSNKKKGRFLVLEADAGYRPPDWEVREVFGMRFEQERNVLPLTEALFAGEAGLTTEQISDGLLVLATLRYTQSNSIALFKDGMALGIGAGQQSRVDCVRLAAAKARTWWLRRHPNVRKLKSVETISRTERINWQMRYAEDAMTPAQRVEFDGLFGSVLDDAAQDAQWRDDWVHDLNGVLLGSDGFLTFRDNLDYAAEIGVTAVVEPGGSVRTKDIARVAAELGMAHVQTGIRLFHH